MSGIKIIARLLVILCCVQAAITLSGCSTTAHLPANKYLLRKNRVVLNTKTVMANKGEKRDLLTRLITQRTNTYSLYGILPYRLWMYNLRYKRLHNLPDTSLPGNAERPVLYDSTTTAKTVLNFRNYLFNQGYFYATVKDTVKYRGKKAYKTFIVNAGNNYLINKVNFDVDDSSILRILKNGQHLSELKKNKTFTFGLLDPERSRLTALVRDQGYYKFSQENIRYVVDTLDKTFLKDLDNPLENALNFISASKSNRKPTLDVAVIVRTADDNANKIFKIGNVTVYPDYNGPADRTDSTMMTETNGNIQFRYHQKYVHSRVLADRVFLKPGQLFSQSDYDKTVQKLNELGIFQYIRVQFTNTGVGNVLECNVYLNKTKKFDFNTNYEVSNGTNYQLGNSASVSFRNKNFAKGANLNMLTLNGGIEHNYNDNIGQTFFEHFSLNTLYYGLNASIDFPKFVAPLRAQVFSKTNLPRTIVSAGTNVINRVQYFTLINTNASFRYNWRETKEKTWDVTPAFINIIRLPTHTAAFDSNLLKFPYLKNSYKNNFIEGENVSYVFNNSGSRPGRNYSRYKMSMEEAGGLLSVFRQLSNTANNINSADYARYVKLDLDLQRFFVFRHSSIATRLYAGIGIPYGNALTLPYVKQYYVGGPYSLRGWRIRSLGPGSYYDSSNINKSVTLDRTGDIRLEGNGEFRFLVAPLFAGAVKMNGAFFTDAGNIWLFKSDTSFNGGELGWGHLGRDIAVDVGLGARFEIASFLTFRLDAAIPVKKPYWPANGGWVLREIDLGNATWRANNVVLNISIGYPF